MEINQLPITVCHTSCPACKLPMDFLMFESGAGGEFSTYIGDTTNTIYRLNLTNARYSDVSTDTLLAPVISLENGQDNLREIPNKVICKACSSIFEATNIEFDQEVTVDAVIL